MSFVSVNSKANKHVRTAPAVRALRDAAVERLQNRIDYERTHVLNYREQDLKLERMRALLHRLGDPQDRLKIVHIAGTKGKGSTGAMISSILTAAGHRTGLFTSPHFDRLEQRFAIDGEEASAADLVNVLDRIWPAVDQLDALADRGQSDLGRPTYFEITTAIAVLHFADQNVDAAVLEVGMGGRLDSTNVCRPLVSVITSISFDHTQQLGETLGDIAREKAGIIKPGVPVISGVTAPEPAAPIRQIASERNAPLRQLGAEFQFQYLPAEADASGGQPALLDFVSQSRGSERPIRRLEVGLPGRHQASNAAVALAVIESLREQGWNIPEESVRDGLATTSLPGRIEQISRDPTIVVDTAHNVASVQALVDTLAGSFSGGRRTLVLATSRDKDLLGMLRVLVEHFDRIVVTRYENNPRATSVEELDTMVAQLSDLPRRSFDRPEHAWDYLRKHTGANELICITGSFFIAAEMRKWIDAKPLAPSPDAERTHRRIGSSQT